MYDTEYMILHNIRPWIRSITFFFWFLDSRMLILKCWFTNWWAETQESTLNTKKKKKISLLNGLAFSKEDSLILLY